MARTSVETAKVPILVRVHRLGPTGDEMFFVEFRPDVLRREVDLRLSKRGENEGESPPVLVRLVLVDLRVGLAVGLRVGVAEGVAAFKARRAAASS